MNKWDISFPNLGINFGLSNVAFQTPSIGPVPTLFIYWYALIIAAGIILGLFLAIRATKKYHISKDLVFDVLLYGLIAGIVGARAYYVIFSWQDSFAGKDILEIINIRNGGLAIYGGIIGALISTYIVTRVYKISFLKLIDFLIPYLALGQAIGRWGNFFNQEAFGTPTNLPWAMQSQATQVPVHPTFLYESLLCFALFALLLWIRRNPHIRGMVFVTYLSVYGVGRALIESLRTDSLWFMGMRVSQILGLVFAILALAGFAYLYKKGTVEHYAPAPLPKPEVASDSTEDAEEPKEESKEDSK